MGQGLQTLPFFIICKMSEHIKDQFYQTGQLFEDFFSSSDQENNVESERKNKSTYRLKKLYELPLEKIQTYSSQPRRYFDAQKLENLAESIRDKGILQPVLFRVKDGIPILVAGERRLRAAQLAGLQKIPALLVEGETSVISLIENIQREDLNPIEEAEALERLIQEQHYKIKDLVLLLGKAKSTISEIRKLNELPDEIKDECRNGNLLSRNVLVEIAKQPTQEIMLQLFRQIKAEGLKSNQVRALTRTRAGKRDATSVALKKISEIQKSFQKLKLNEMKEEKKESFRHELVNLRDKIDEVLNRFNDTND